MTAPRRAICLTVDALSASYLGPYGNTWIRTPAFNRLAGESLVLDRVLIETPSLLDAFSSLWTGIAPWLDSSNRQDCAIGAYGRSAGIPTAFLTDEHELINHPVTQSFDEVVQIPLVSRDEPVRHWEESAMAKFFAGAIDWLQTHNQFGLLWLHAGALRHVWDAPLELREMYTDEDDPRPADVVIPPVRQVTGNANPDELLALRHAYAGQVAVLDHCLQWFLDAIAAMIPDDSLLLALLGARGYPLGEHASVGLTDAHLFSDLTHGACFLRAPAGVAGDLAGLHSQALVQPRDLHATLREWFNLVDRTEEPRTGATESTTPVPSVSDTSGEPVYRSDLYSAYSLLSLHEGRHDWPRLLAMARHESGEVALATPAWYFRVTPSHTERSSLGEIYAKPDDCFEANEVSARCQDEIAEFQDVLRRIDASSSLDSLEIPLSQRLVHGSDTLVTSPATGQSG